MYSHIILLLSLGVKFLFQRIFISEFIYLIFYEKWFCMRMSVVYLVRFLLGAKLLLINLRQTEENVVNLYLCEVHLGLW